MVSEVWAGSATVGAGGGVTTASGFGASGAQAVSASTAADAASMRWRLIIICMALPGLFRH
jgi:hypothetical protein